MHPTTLLGLRSFIMAYSTRTVRHTLVNRAYDLFLDESEGRQTALGTLVKDAVTAELISPVLVDGAWTFVKGAAPNIPGVAQLFEEIDSVISDLPRVAVPTPIIGHAATRESNPYSDVIANGQGALEPLENGTYRFAVVDDIAKSLFERDIDALANQYSVTLPVGDYERIQRKLTTKIKDYGAVHSERIDDANVRLWLPSVGTEQVREELRTQLRGAINEAARERLHEYLVQGYGRSFFGESTSLETNEQRLRDMGPTQFDELHRAIGRELHAARQAEYGADHDERAARIADLICNQGGWSVTNNFLQPRSNPASGKMFPTRPPFDTVLDSLLGRKPEALQRFESAINGRLTGQAKQVMNLAERARREHERPIAKSARDGSELIASDKNRNMAVARSAGIADNIQHELLADALSKNSRDRYARNASEAEQLATAALQNIASAPTYQAAMVRRAVYDEARRSLPRDSDGRPNLEAAVPRTFQTTLTGNRHQWETNNGARHDGVVNGVITAFYGSTDNGTVRNFLSQMRGPKMVKGTQRWDSPFPPFMDQPLLAVIQPILVPRDLETVGRLLRQGFGRETALELYDRRLLNAPTRSAYARRPWRRDPSG